MLRRLSKSGCLVLVGALIAAGCAAAPVDETSNFDGQWVVTELVTGGELVPLGTSRILLSIDETDAILIGETGCNQILGSFTLVPSEDGSGPAGFTVPGGSSNECLPEDQAIEDALIATMEAVVQWKGSGPDLVFIGPAGQDPTAAPMTLMVLSPAG